LHVPAVLTILFLNGYIKMSAASVSHLPTFLIMCMLGSGWSFAQNSAPYEPYGSDVISARPVRFFAGAVLGGFWHSHEGSFSPNCECRFGDRDGLRMTLGMAGVVQFPKLGVAISLTAVFHDYSAVFTYPERRLTKIIGPVSDTLLDYEKTSDVDLRMLRLAPAFQWYFPHSAVFIFGGADIGVTLKGEYDNIERVMTPGFAYEDSSASIALLPRGDIPGGARIAVGLLAGIGADIRLTTWAQLTPRLHVTAPLTAVSSQDPTWRIITAQAEILLLLRL